ncbi:unnamed protein product [Meganyctiphanes norvegica]|uniref:Uncharacterized protein n=1 Tax=Meganyctiphanes norvegica TaxID=48144 RepID=A0AAV2R2Q8_MEGNR
MGTEQLARDAGSLIHCSFIDCIELVNCNIDHIELANCNYSRNMESIRAILVLSLLALLICNSESKPQSSPGSETQPQSPLSSDCQDVLDIDSCNDIQSKHSCSHHGILCKETCGECASIDNLVSPNEDPEEVTV